MRSRAFRIGIRHRSRGTVGLAALFVLAAGLVAVALIAGTTTTAAPAACRFDVDGDGIDDLVLGDVDGDGRCEFPERTTVLRGTIRFTADTPVEFRGTTLLDATGIVVEDGADLFADPVRARQLTLLARRDGIRSAGSLALRTSDDLVLRALGGDVVLGGHLALEAGDRLVVETRTGSIAVTPEAPLPPAFALLSHNRLDIAARGPNGGILLAEAGLGARQVAVSTRANLSVTGDKQIVVRDGALVTTDPGRTGLPGTTAGTLQLVGSGRILVTGDSVIDGGHGVRIATVRATQHLCLEDGAALEAFDALDRPGLIDLRGVRGMSLEDGTVTIAGRLLGALDAGACPAAPEPSTTTTLTPVSTTTSTPGGGATTTTTTTAPPDDVGPDSFRVTAEPVSVSPAQRGDEVPVEFRIANATGRDLGRQPFTVGFEPVPPDAPIRIDPGTGTQELSTIFNSTTSQQVRVKIVVPVDAAPGTYVVQATFRFGGFTVIGTALVTVVASAAELVVDVDVDSDNDNGTGPPDRSDAEEAIEETVPGKWIAINDDDDDADGLADFGDGTNRDGKDGTIDDQVAGENDFVPLVVSLSAPVDLQKAQLTITYPASDPAATDLAATPPVLGAGRLRLWRRAGADPRRAASVIATPPGDYVPPGPYTPAQLGFTDAARTVTLFVEGIRASAADGERVTVALDPDGAGPAKVSSTDVVLITVVGVDVDVDSDNDEAGATPARTSLAEDLVEGRDQDPDRPGKIVPLDVDDDDGDLVMDRGDGYDLDATDARDDRNAREDDFVPMVVELPAAVDPATARLTVAYEASDPAAATRADSMGGIAVEPAGTGRLRLWRKPGTEARMAATANTDRDAGDWVAPGEYLPARLGLDATHRTVTLYVEGVRASAAVAGDPITLTLDPDGPGKAQALHADVVRVTVAGAAFARSTPDDATGNKFGYDESVALFADDDHVSVRKADASKVRLALSGLPDTRHVRIVSADAAVAKITDPGKVATPVTLTVSGQNKDKAATRLEVRAGTATGLVLGRLTVDVYKPISLVGKYFRVFKAGVDATKPPDPKPADISAAANGHLKYYVASLAVGASKEVGIAFDLNGNGRLDFFNSAPNIELDALLTALAARAVGAGFQDIVLMKDAFFDRWYLKDTVDGTGTPVTEIELAGGGDLLPFKADRTGETFAIETPTGGNRETFKIVGRVGNTITIDTDPATAAKEGLVLRHPKTADPKTSETLVRSEIVIAGLSSNVARNQPALLVGTAEAEVGFLAAHEQSHGQRLDDVKDTTNVMHCRKDQAFGVVSTRPFTITRVGSVVTGACDDPKKDGSGNQIFQRQWDIPTR